MIALFLCIVFLAANLFAVDCVLYPAGVSSDGIDRYVLVCDFTNPEEEDQEALLNKEQCEGLKSSIIELLINARSQIENMRYEYDTVYNTFGNMNGQLGDFTVILQNSKNYYSDTNEYYVVYNAFQDFKTNFDEAHAQLAGLRTYIQTAYNGVNTAISDAANVTCPENQECSAGGGGEGGSASCPCQDEFRQVVTALNNANEGITIIATNLQSVGTYVQDLGIHLTGISNDVSSIMMRLNRPDDRMYEELLSIYESVTNRYAGIVRSSVDFPPLLYSLNQMLRGEGSSDERLNLSTEGLVSVFSLVGNMVGLEMSRQQLGLVDGMYTSLTNSIEWYYKLFNNITRTSTTWIPGVDKEIVIHDAMTNVNETARNRWLKLVSGRSGAAVTNWFERVEIYLQGLNGWWDSVPNAGLIEEQERQTEDTIEYSLDYTTNRLGAVVASLGDGTNVVTEAVMAVRQAFNGLQVTPVLPSYLVICPEINISNTSFGPVHLETSRFSEFINLVRDTFLMVWKLTIWFFYLLLIYGVWRTLTLVVAYVIQFFQRL